MRSALTTVSVRKMIGNLSAREYLSRFKRYNEPMAQLLVKSMQLRYEVKRNAAFILGALRIAKLKSVPRQPIVIRLLKPTNRFIGIVNQHAPLLKDGELLRKGLCLLKRTPHIFISCKKKEDATLASGIFWPPGTHASRGAGSSVGIIIFDSGRNVNKDLQLLCRINVKAAQIALFHNTMRHPMISSLHGQGASLAFSPPLEG